MRLYDLDEVTKLRNHRNGVLELRRRAEDQPLTCNVGYAGYESEIAKWFDVTPIRKAIMLECDRFLSDNANRLEQLGVQIEDTPPTGRDNGGE